MLALGGEARYADLIERTLYNAVLVGLSLDGQSYFYQNPLEDDGLHRREPWFGCACCPPNIARTLASLPGHFYSTSDTSQQGSIWVHLYAEGSATIDLPDGQTVRLAQRTRYPWEGEIELEVDGEGTLTLFLRIPAWCEEGASIALNGQPFGGAIVSGSYAEVRRVWRAGDVVELNLPMPPRRVACHPYVAENAGRVALMRGPILYCLEQVDHPDLNLRDIILPADEPLSAELRPNLLGGVAVLRGRGIVIPPDEGWTGKLYRSGSHSSAVSNGQEADICAVPYYAWANREPGAMRVWLRT
jgi:DUF1680 family protein